MQEGSFVVFNYEDLEGAIRTPSKTPSGQVGWFRKCSIFSFTPPLETPQELNSNIVSGNLYCGGCFVLHNLVPKVLRNGIEIRYLVAKRTNLQRFVLKILPMLSCEEVDSC